MSLISHANASKCWHSKSLSFAFLLWHPFVNLYSLNSKQCCDLKGGGLVKFSHVIPVWNPSASDFLPFSPVGPDWRNVSSCKRWLPYCGICPVEGRLALLLGQSESPHPPFWPPRGTQLEGWWGDARYDLPPPSLPFTVTEYLYLMSLAFPMLKEWPCCLDDGRVTGFGTLDSLYRSWQAVNALHMCVFMVLFHGGWRFCSLSAPKQ